MKTKKNVHRKIAYIDRKTQAVTAGVNFEDIDITIDGKGSEYWDYEYHFILHSSSVASAQVEILVNSITSYDLSNMYGVGSTAGANVVTDNAMSRAIAQLNPSFNSGKLTGYIGNKRHFDALNSYSTSSNVIRKKSAYIPDTSNEIVSTQFRSTATTTITYSLFITAVPKVQYNPHAILLKNLTLSSQTADVIFGGVNDTVGLGDLDGDAYDYLAVSSGLTTVVNGFINEVETANKTMQQMVNSNGGLASNNQTKDHDMEWRSDSVVNIVADTGRKKMITCQTSHQVAAQQHERYYTNPNTSTKMTSLLLRPSASTSGNVQLYAIPKGLNGDLTPWDFRQTIDISGDFSAGHSFERPDWACLMKVDFVGDSAVLSNLQLDFNNLGLNTDIQYLYSGNSNTLAGFESNNNTIGTIDKSSRTTCIASLKNGANRPMITEYYYGENTIQLLSSTIKDSSTVFTTAQIKASNTNTINGLLTVSYF